MTEKEYMIVSNLINVRIAKNLIADILTDDGFVNKDKREILITLSQWETSLSSKIEGF